MTLNNNLYTGMASPLTFMAPPQMPQCAPGQHTILRLPQVKHKTGLSRSTIYNRIKARQFPPGINLGGNAVGWLMSDVDAFIERCAATTGGAA